MDDEDSKVKKIHTYPHDKHWVKHFWRPICAAVYLFICLFDFVIMPSVVEYNTEKNEGLSVVIEELHKIDESEVKIALINKANVETKSWKPLTLMGGGMFHIAFGALLTGAAVTRGLERKELAKST